MSRTLVLACLTSCLALTGLAHGQTAPAAAASAAPAPAATAAAPASTAADASEGKLAYYGSKFAGRKTASGQIFNPQAMTMAHKTLPFGTQVRVTRLDGNKRSVVVRVNDRGPTQPDRIGDVSLAAARKLGMLRPGVVSARIEVLAAAPAPKARKAAKAA